MSEQPKLLVIELDTLEAVPKVIFKGEEVNSKMRVDFSWITKDDRNTILESPYIRIESVEGYGTKNPAVKVQGYNEPIQDDHTTALMLAVVGLNKALELHQSMNAAVNENPFEDAGGIIEKDVKGPMKEWEPDDETKDDSYTGEKDV